MATETDLEHALFRRLIWRIVPLLAVCWVVNWIDRINIGFARFGFQKALHISDTQFGVIVGIYSIGYLLLEVPSNLLMQKIGARKTMSRILLLWGLITIATAFVRDGTQFSIARLALGAAEAGLFPGAILYLTYWFPAHYRARVTSRFIIANAVAGIIGAPTAGWILKYMPGVGHLAGWQWLYIIEGIPPVLLAGIVWFSLSDGPQTAAWLTAEEKAVLQRSLARDEARQTQLRHTGFGAALKDVRVYLLAVAFCCTIMCTGNVLQIWAPAIIRDSGVGDVFKVGWLAALPWAVGILGMLLVCRHSDRHDERRWHFVFIGVTVAAAMLTLPSLAHGVVPAVIGLTVMTTAALSATAVFWTITATYLSPEARPGGIALVNTLGQFGGLATPIFIGWAKTETGDMRLALSIVGLVVLLGVISVALAFPKRLLSSAQA